MHDGGSFIASQVTTWVVTNFFQIIDKFKTYYLFWYSQDMVLLPTVSLGPNTDVQGVPDLVPTDISW
jgi:hypothetical protein